MSRRLLSLLTGFATLLIGCGQPASSPLPSPSVPVGTDWSYVAPVGSVQPLALTPGVNSLTYETLVTATNGWGSVEINRSNGERGATDGRPLRLNGVSYAKGFGTHALSELSFALSRPGQPYCTSFTAEVGVDDEVGAAGSVVFQVYGDGELLFDSGVMTGTSATQSVAVNLEGRRELQLVVTTAGDGASSDHADWVNPQVLCTPAQVNINFFPGVVVAPENSRRTVLVRVDIQPPPNGPFTFKLKPFDFPLHFGLAEPDRTYTVTTFPALVPVLVAFQTLSSSQTYDVVRYTAEYAGKSPDDFRRTSLRWNVVR
ncbi:NPCBM/NEW2 domain-containing protein [Deinococcus oregonensis]|uniref:NPCBM/NEW2 domain-containing protein n=1 Tax=Deinococcus oregonensis TaxID=1805970 RepID=A0ABV6B280_9DEIO